jgi:hypothetical protein
MCVIIATYYAIFTGFKKKTNIVKYEMQQINKIKVMFSLKMYI